MQSNNSQCIDDNICGLTQGGTTIVPCIPSQSQIEKCEKDVENAEMCFQNCQSINTNASQFTEPFIDIYIVNNTNIKLSRFKDSISFLPSGSSNTGTWVSPPSSTIETSEVDYIRAIANNLVPNQTELSSSSNTLVVNIIYNIGSIDESGGTLNINVCRQFAPNVQDIGVCEGNQGIATLKNNPKEVSLSQRLNPNAIFLELNGTISGNFCSSNSACPLGQSCENNVCVDPFSDSDTEIIGIISVSVVVIVVLFLIFLVIVRSYDTKQKSSSPKK